MVPAPPYLEVVAAGRDRLLGAARGRLDRPVPACPGWDVADLVVHMGQVWRWAADVVATGERAERIAAPAERAEASLLGWAFGQAERLVTSLGAAAPDGACWTFGPPPTAAFWARRQALETVLHARDVEEAGGLPLPIDADLAADGVDEFLTVMAPRALGRHPGEWGGEAVHLHRTDGEGEWLVRLGPDGAVVTERAHGKGDLALRGPAEALWLWCTSRAAADVLGLEVFGDTSLARRWQDSVVV